MHLLATRPGGLADDTAGLIRIEQDPADIIILSAADTTLALLAAAHAKLPADFPSVRLCNLLYLRQAASIDMYLDEVLQHARVIIVDHLGGESYWPYGTEQLIQLAHAHKKTLVMFSGDRSEDANLINKSTAAPAQCHELWRYLREGGADNAQQFFNFIGQQFFQRDDLIFPPKPLPDIAIYHPAHGIATIDDWKKEWRAEQATVAIIFYRAHLQAGNTLVFDALCTELQKQYLNPLPIALTSLKDPLCMQTLQQLCADHAVALVLNTTAFCVASINETESNGNTHAPLAGNAPVFQIILSGGDRESWQDDTQGLNPRDIAMQVALPEVDGRIITRAISFKGLAYRCEKTQTDVVLYQPDTERLAFVVELAARWCRLRTLENCEKRVALILANYPAKEGRIGNGVGLDTPNSAISILRMLQAQHYRTQDNLTDTIPADGDALLRELLGGVTNDPEQWALRPARQSFSLANYLKLFEQLPAVNKNAIIERWGAPDVDPMLRNDANNQPRFMIAGIRYGNIFVGIQPSRGYNLDPYATYHSPDLAPPHYYLAFYFWLRSAFNCDAIVHVGKHGNLEWLPGKTIALSNECWPDLIFGPLPHLYPFIVNDPGEGSQAKRRAQAVIIDHLMPPLTRAENYGPLQDLERQVDEYYEALLVDPKRALLLRKNILANIVDNNLHRDLGLDIPRDRNGEDALLTKADAYLCEVKESQIRDGLHIFGRSPTGIQQRDTLLALARFPSGANNNDSGASLIQALACDFELYSDAGREQDFDPLDADWSAPWLGEKPKILEAISAEPWRNCGDTRERLELFATQLIETIIASGNDTEEAISSLPKTQRVLNRIREKLLPAIDACGAYELNGLRDGLDGKFVAPGPSGAPTRGRPDVLPTGRNFYSVDTRAIPTPTAWTLGLKSASILLERYLQDHGDYPRAIGLSVWGTATMRTGGDDIAQAFALIGARPQWATGSHRVTGVEILPMSLLDRPRIDVTLRVSGFFRDAFANVMQLFDGAVQAIAELDEPAEINPLRARVLKEKEELITRGLSSEEARRQAGLRIFGSKPGAYGAGLQALIDERCWNDDEDLATAYRNWGGYAYSQNHYGETAPERFSERLATIDLVLQNQDNREHDLLDSDDYYQFQGGMTAAVRHFSGAQPEIYHADHSNPAAPKVRSLQEEISRVVRARVVNPKWLSGVKRHGYKGAAEMAATVDYLFAYDATARVVGDYQYALVTDAYVNDDTNREFMQQHNPAAFREVCERLLEAIQRGLWQNPGEFQTQIEHHLLDSENRMEADTLAEKI
ncbi:MAG: CobN component of cobalt chelatase involved in biosynthesis [Verrucomicrobiaceae bacterium]|nr:CobN component of cobalt chelatase involved in biosynthesis [Verrucomicrobiaceae bacterium]